jgi:putative ABC transport system substrate-binding protein
VVKSFMASFNRLVTAVVFLVLAAALAADAQPAGKLPLIGWLLEAHAPSGQPENFEAFRQGLRALGYVEGQSVSIVYRSGEGREARLAPLATELVRLKPDVIVADGVGSIRAARNETSVIPIVMMHSTDPVATGLVASLARPGGNITGVITLSPELLGKRLELLKENFRGVTRVAVLTGQKGPAVTAWLQEMERAARSLALQLQVLEIRTPGDLDPAFQAATMRQADALVELPAHVFHEHGKRLVEFAAKNRLPAVYHTRDFVEAGGLMSYGAHYPDLYRRVAVYVDKILKGAKPSDLPIEQPTKFELVINMKTAKALGLTISPSLLLRADYVIE